LVLKHEDDVMVELNLKMAVNLVGRSSRRSSCKYKAVNLKMAATLGWWGVLLLVDPPVI
jgi:hypothetical protein